MLGHFISPMEHSILSRQSVRKFGVGLELLSVSAYAFSRADSNSYIIFEWSVGEEFAFRFRLYFPEGVRFASSSGVEGFDSMSLSCGVKTAR